jgi:hypothetical protein
MGPRTKNLTKNLKKEILYADIGGPVSFIITSLCSDTVRYLYTNIDPILIYEIKSFSRINIESYLENYLSSTEQFLNNFRHRILNISFFNTNVSPIEIPNFNSSGIILSNILDLRNINIFNRTNNLHPFIFRPSISLNYLVNFSLLSLPLVFLSLLPFLFKYIIPVLSRFLDNIQDLLMSWISTISRYIRSCPNANHPASISNITHPIDPKEHPWLDIVNIRSTQGGTIGGSGDGDDERDRDRKRPGKYFRIEHCIYTQRILLKKWVLQHLRALLNFLNERNFLDPNRYIWDNTYITGPLVSLIANWFYPRFNIIQSYYISHRNVYFNPKSSYSNQTTNQIYLLMHDIINELLRLVEIQRYLRGYVTTSYITDPHDPLNNYFYDNHTYNSSHGEITLNNPLIRFYRVITRIGFIDRINQLINLIQNFTFDDTPRETKEDDNE